MEVSIGCSVSVGTIGVQTEEAVKVNAVVQTQRRKLTLGPSSTFVRKRRRQKNSSAQTERTALARLNFSLLRHDKPEVEPSRGWQVERLGVEALRCRGVELLRGSSYGRVLIQPSRPSPESIELEKVNRELQTLRKSSVYVEFYRALELSKEQSLARYREKVVMLESALSERQL